jgi:hypothetical protein
MTSSSSDSEDFRISFRPSNSFIRWSSALIRFFVSESESSSSDDDDDDEEEEERDLSCFLEDSYKYITRYYKFKNRQFAFAWLFLSVLIILETF